MTPMPFRLLATALLVLAVISTACGDGDEEAGTGDKAALEQYYRDLQAAIDEASQRFQALPQISADETTSEEIVADEAADFFDDLADLFADFEENLRKIDPPEEVAELHDEGTRATEEYVAKARDYQILAAESDSFEESLALTVAFSADSFDIFTGFGQACLGLRQIATDNGVFVDLQCETGESAGRGPRPDEVESVSCFRGIIPGPSGSGDDAGQCVEGTVKFAGIRGNVDAPMPPLPSDLAAASDYIEFEIDEDPPSVAGIALPLTEPVGDFSTLGFYTYQDGEWRRLANVVAIRDGKAEGEFTAFPANLAVLNRVPP